MTDPDVDRRIADWLETGPHELPDPTRRAILVGVRAAPRRHGRAPGRAAPAWAVAGLGTITVVCIALGAVVWALSAPPSPSLPGSSLIPTTASSPSPVLLPLSVRPLDPGTYRLGTGAVPGAPLDRMTVTVPDGWLGIRAGGVANLIQDTDDLRAGGVHTGSVLVWLPTDVYVDPCDTSKGLTVPPLGPSVDDFVTALRTVPGYRISPPVPVDLFGYHGVYLEEAGPDSVAGCRDGFSHPWRTIGNASAQYNFDGQHDRLWVMDVDGQRVVFDLVGEAAATTTDGEDPASMAEQQQVFGSIRIESSAHPSARPSPME